jgi:hypothetical protein
MTTLPKVDTNCTTPSLMPTLNGNSVLSFSTHGQQSAAKGSLTTVSRSDIRLLQYFDCSALGLVRRWRLIGYFPIHLLPQLTANPWHGGAAERDGGGDVVQRVRHRGRHRDEQVLPGPRLRALHRAQEVHRADQKVRQPHRRSRGASGQKRRQGALPPSCANPSLWRHQPGTWEPHTEPGAPTIPHAPPHL